MNQQPSRLSHHVAVLILCLGLVCIGCIGWWIPSALSRPTTFSLVVVGLIALALFVVGQFIEQPWMEPVRLELLEAARASKIGWVKGELSLPKPWIIFSGICSIATGWIVYGEIVQTQYAALAAAYRDADIIPSAIENEAPDGVMTGSREINARDVFLLLRHYGLLTQKELSGGVKSIAPLRSEHADACSSPAEASPAQALVNLAVECDFNTRYKLNSGTINFLFGLSQWQPASEKDRRYKLNLVLGALAAQPPPTDETSLATWLASAVEPGPRINTTALRDEVNSHYGVDFDQRILPWRERQPELSSQQIAGLIAMFSKESRRGTDVDDLSERSAYAFLQKVQARLLLELRSDPGVRHQRMILNAVIGPERFLVIVLGIWFVLLATARAAQVLPHLAHAEYIESRFLEAASANALSDCRAVRRDFANNVLKTDGSNSNNGAGLQTIGSYILSAAEREMTSDNPGIDLIKHVSDDRRTSIAHSRVIFDALLPTFPAIGFIGTVLSLLVAMSKADLIVRAADSTSRGVATTVVTDTLSLCFSTTLMALICLAVFAPLALLQADREQRIVTRIERLVEQRLRPEAQ